MAKPNYSFEKRKRELAKKAAKEAKRLRKEEKPAAGEDSTATEQTGGENVEETASETGTTASAAETETPVG